MKFVTTCVTTPTLFLRANFLALLNDENEWDFPSSITDVSMRLDMVYNGKKLFW